MCAHSAPLQMQSGRTAAKVMEGMPLRAMLAMSAAVPSVLSNWKTAVKFRYPVALAAEAYQHQIPPLPFLLDIASEAAGQTSTRWTCSRFGRVSAEEQHNHSRPLPGA